MTDFELMQLIGEVDDQYIMESRRRPGKKTGFRWRGLAVACLLVVVICGAGGGIWVSLFRAGQSSLSGGAPGTAEDAFVADRNYDVGETETAADGADTGSAPVPETEELTESGDLSAYGAALLARAAVPVSADYDDAAAQTAIREDNRTADETGTALNTFAYMTAAQVLQDGENACFSPLSLYQALTALAGGAGGQTRNELLSFLGQSDLETLISESGKLCRCNYRDNDAETLKIAVSLWLPAADAASYSADWLSGTAENCYASVYQMNSAGEDTAPALGQWLSDCTGGLIRSAAASDGLGDSGLMLANTVLYQARWADAFSSDRTESGTFTAASGETVTCEFMHRTVTDGSYIETSEYIKSSLALSTGRMIVVLPKEGVDADSLLSEEKLWEIFENGDYSQGAVEWSVPKFETASEYTLSAVLEGLGVTAAFDAGSADFSGITEEQALSVGEILQETYISVDESGIAAEAGTGTEAAGEAAEAGTAAAEMNLNRPFLYLITADDGSPVFIGIVRNPAG